VSEQSFSEFLLRVLEWYEVEYLFGIPGVHTAELYRGLQDSCIEHITPRHEQGAGFAADGYARISAKPGVCLVITGPGVSNIITAMAQAYADSIPMLVISSVNTLAQNRQGNGHLHQLPNQSALVEQVAAFSYTITGAHELLYAMARAYSVFEGERARPVHLEIPIDIMSHSVKLSLPAHRPRFSLPQASADTIEAVRLLCESATHPIILAGGGARAASVAIKALAERLNAPVVMSINARGMLSSEHPLALNASASLEPVRQLIEQADIVLALGTELGPTDYDIWLNGGLRLSGQLVRVDISQTQMHQNYPADVAVLSDVELAVQALLASLNEPQLASVKNPLAVSVKPTLSALQVAQSNDYVAANRMISALWKVLPDAIVVGDSTQPVYAGNDITDIPDTARWFNSATGFGTLGYALPAAIGAKRAAPHQPVIALAGDGGVQFSVAELATAKQANTPLTLIVWDNGGYGEIHDFMLDADIAPEGVDLYTPDFAMIANAYGWQVRRVSRLHELSQAVLSGYEEQSHLLILGAEKLAL